MTTYYIDADNGSDANNGLGPDSAAVTDKPWLTLDQFTENARSAGDIAILRRGTTAQYDDGTDLTFTSDGDLGNPIVIEADFFGSSANGLHASDDWNGGDQFADSAQTFTMVFGSKTHTASASITGISVGDWVFNTTDGDDAKLFAYEVAAVSGTTLTLYFPYKGSTGATKTLRVMPAAPVWGTLTDAFQINIDIDYFWKIQGLEATGSDINGVVEIDSSFGTELVNLILKPDTTDSGIEMQTDISLSIRGCRIDGGSLASTVGFIANGPKFSVCDTLFHNLAIGIRPAFSPTITLIDCEFTNNSTADVDLVNNIAYRNSTVFYRNCEMNSTTRFSGVDPSTFDSIDHLFEDDDGMVSKTLRVGTFSEGKTTYLESDTGTVRSGGSNISAKVTPNTVLSTLSEFTKLRLFETFIFASTASKTYDIYFKSNATANWTANPTADELFIELEAWGHASNNFREITKSTGTLSFTTLTTWNKLSVTVAPAQAGVAYLRCWYMKPKESAKTNEFFVDLLPVVT